MALLAPPRLLSPLDGKDSVTLGAVDNPVPVRELDAQPALDLGPAHLPPPPCLVRGPAALSRAVALLVALERDERLDAPLARSFHVCCHMNLSNLPLSRKPILRLSSDLRSGNEGVKLALPWFSTYLKWPEGVRCVLVTQEGDGFGIRG